MKALGLIFIAACSHPIAESPAPFAAPSAQRVSHHDRVYAAEQFSNTVSVTDPADNRVLGIIRLGDTQPANLSPLYRGQVLVHGMGASPDHKTLAVVSIGSNSVSFIDTATNRVKYVTYVGRSPHEAMFTPDGREVWVTIRGADYIAVLDANTFEEKLRIKVPNGPGMQVFSPDGQLGYVCSSFTPETVIVSVSTHQIVGRVTQPSPFCPDIAIDAAGTQVWLTLKDVGKVMVFDARPPFAVRATLDTGPITNHVNLVTTSKGTFAYVTVGGTNTIKVFRTIDLAMVATIPVGKLPHGVWGSGDGSRVYVGLENSDMLVAIDTATNRVIAEMPIGQAPQAVVYVPDAVTSGDDASSLQKLAREAATTHLLLTPVAGGTSSSVTLFDQGLTQVLQAAIVGLEPRRRYVLALAEREDGTGAVQAIAELVTNPAGAAIVNAVGPIRQLVNDDHDARRYLTVLPGTADQFGAPVLIQSSTR